MLMSPMVFGQDGLELEVFFLAQDGRGVNGGSMEKGPRAGWGFPRVRTWPEGSLKWVVVYTLFTSGNVYDSGLGVKRVLGA
jgi:hypothetical protein